MLFEASTLCSKPSGRTSDLASILYAYLCRARVPNAPCLLDFTLNRADVDCATAWQGKIDRSTLKRSYSFASCMVIADDARLTGDYKDVHCWAFTPASFAGICAQLAQNKLLNFECAEFHDTAFNEFEFFVTMRRSGDSEQNARSWRNVEALAQELPFPTGQSNDL